MRKSLAGSQLFPKTKWERRVKSWLSGNGAATNPFRDANRRSIERCLTDKDSGFRMVVNIPADALLSFLETGRYLNAYDLPVVAGQQRGPSQSRVRVDALLGFTDPSRYYFGAASMGGTGIRFYGEYCMVLNRDAVAPNTQLLDRNSYDVLWEPIEGDPGIRAIVASMKGQWQRDAVHMLVLKALPELSSAARLVTLGTVADAILHDEDFVEVHKRGAFSPGDLEEIRETPEDQAIHSFIVDQFDSGDVPKLEEVLWVVRRFRVRAKLREHRLRSRVVASAGRGSRWD
jgi:hypothetical protein